MYRAKTLTANLMVKNVEKAIAFYTDNLAFEVIMTAPENAPCNWAMLRKDNVNIMFQLKENLLEEYPQIQPSVGGSLILYCDIEGIESLYNHLKDCVTLHKDLHRTFYGKREFTIKDSDGYLITFGEGE